MKILILGATGMLGNAIFNYFSSLKSFIVFGTIKNKKSICFFKNNESKKIIPEVNAFDVNKLKAVINEIKPHCIINCIGAIKQKQGNNPLEAIPLNAHLPHFLWDLCLNNGSKLIHFSTDCVFSGKDGGYKEDSFPDADDVYGRTKILGEIYNYPALTIRTSIIGHELTDNKSLVNWFLSQNNSINGYSKVIYTGLPTIELAIVLENIIVNHPDLYGVYHLSSDKISKYNLLKLIKNVYQKEINIIKYDELVIDRSLDSTLLKNKIRYVSPPWDVLIKKMHNFYYKTREVLNA